MQGIIQSVETYQNGDYPIETAPTGATVLYFGDATPFDPAGGQLDIDGVTLNYVSADLDEDTVTLAEPLIVEVVEDDFVSPLPPTESTHAAVALGDDIVMAEIPHHLKPLLEEGGRAPGAGEAVIVQEVAPGLHRVVEVVGEKPAIDARFIPNGEDMLLEAKERLGDALATNEAAISQAQTDLSAANTRINEAFGEIDLKVDAGYVDAAKQQAIDAAAIDAQTKADEAEAEAIAAAQSALTQAETDLQVAIASGDAAAIADAEAKIATAKTEAIDAAADDAAAKASAAQTAAVQTAQAALDQAESDLQVAIASGDAAAIADAEAKIATAKQEAIDAAASDATAKAAEAMQKANAALTAAQSAQATADNAIRTYYAETPPWANGTTQPDDVLGDMWYQDSTGQAYRWNGTSWKVIQDASIGEALAAAADAQTTADGKITAFYQPNEPLEGDEGDMWFDTDNDSAIHRRTGGQWVALLDPKALADAAEQAAKTAAAADATAKAEAAEAAAVQTAAADAQAKADAAEAAAEAAAKTYADTVASGASQSAIDAAAADAQAKADAARDAAIAAAELDATAKAEQAEADAAATAAADATAKANAAQAAAEEVAHLVENRALSRGTDLVTNGTGFLGNNYNFSSLTYDGSDAPVGMTGSFVSAVGGNYWTDELIPVDGSKTYQVSASVRQQVPGVVSYFYLGLVPLDATGNQISVWNYAYRAGTTTTLAQPLNPGDTTIVLTDGSAWTGAGMATHQRSIIWWNWTDSLGKTWPKETFSRDTSGFDYFSTSGVSGNTITLNAPYDGPARPAGAELSQGVSGGTYMYLQGRNTAQETWTKYSETLPAYEQDAPNSGRWAATIGRGIPPGTAFVRFGVLANHSSGGGANGGRQAFSGWSISDASAAQQTADQALSDAETKSEAAKQAAIAAAAADATAKAEAAEAAAAATAAADATQKANQAKADAEAAAKAYTDALDTGASDADLAAARTYAEQQAEAARIAAEAAAALDATAKAEAAEAAAAATAAADATAKADAAKAAAIAAAEADATAKADQARDDAKAFATTTANGLAKTFWSTALPGTTQAPQNSTWYRHSGGKIISVFTQTAAGSQGSTWSARPITSDAIDNLDIGKLTAASGTINSLVVNEFAAKLANIIEANIGNLTVTGDTHLEALVAQQIAGDTASFMELTVDQILAGYLQAQWIITEEGSIVAGDPLGARVEITSDGVRVYVVGPNGAPYEAVSMVNGEISFGVIGQDGTRLGGIASDGSVSGTSGSFSKDVRIKGLPVVGQLGGGTLPGWLDNLPRGVIAYNGRTKSTIQVNTGIEFRYLRVTATLYPGRRYRVMAIARGGLASDESALYISILHAPGRSAPPLSSPRLGPYEIGVGTSVGSTGGQRVTATVEGFYTPEVEEVRSFVSAVTGYYGGTPTMQSGLIYVEDVGPLTPDTGGDDENGGTVVYQSTWKATASRVYDMNGNALPNTEGQIEQWYWGGTPEAYNAAAWLYGGGVEESTDAIEFGKTLPQALLGATIHKVEVYLRNKVWYGGVDEGSFILNDLGSSTLPSSKVIDGDPNYWVHDVPSGEGIWIDLPAGWFTNGANRGLTMGDHDGEALVGTDLVTPTSGSFHGAGASDPPKLRITYSR